jgi:hypothetical protein
LWGNCIEEGHTRTRWRIQIERVRANAYILKGMKYGALG